MERKVVYTALFGDYEDLKEPTFVTPGWEYICYTDQPLKSDVWEIKYVECIGDPQRGARKLKITGFAEFDKSFWVDASFIIDTNLDEWWNKYYKGGVTAPKHPLRDCVYEEILACIIGFRGDRLQLESQKEEYKALKIPAHNGIITSGILMRRNDVETIDLCREWYNELFQHSVRDQVALAKVSLNSSILYTYDWDYRKEKDFIYKHHYARR
jgi:hypothetical protein